jgi:hypothetical protein
MDLELAGQLSSINDFTEDNKDQIVPETDSIEFADTSNHIINIVQLNRKLDMRPKQ